MKKYIPLTLIMALTAACGGSGGGTEIITPPDLEPGEIRPVLVIQTDGSRYELSDGAPGFIADETRYLINVSASKSGRDFGSALVYEGNSVVVSAGTDTGSQPNFAGASGTVSVRPTGSATFAGHYSIADDQDVLANAQEHGAITLNFNLGANTLTGTSANSVLVVNGTTDAAGKVTGTVTVDGDTAALTGSFYGASATEVAAGFVNNDFGGYVYGQRPN